MSGEPITAVAKGCLNVSVLDLLSVTVIRRTGASSTTCARAATKDQEKPRPAVIAAATKTPATRAPRPERRAPPPEGVGFPSSLTYSTPPLADASATPWLCACHTPQHKRPPGN